MTIMRLVGWLTWFLFLSCITAATSTKLYGEHNETGRFSRNHHDQNCEMLLY